MSLAIAPLSLPVPAPWLRRGLKIARLLLVVLADLFYLSIANTLLVPIACDWWGSIGYRRQGIAAILILTRPVHRR